MQCLDEDNVNVITHMKNALSAKCHVQLNVCFVDRKMWKSVVSFLTRQKVKQHRLA